VRDEEILDITQDADGPGNLCRQFIDKVLERGAHDNTTIISVFLTGIKKRRVGTLKKIVFSLFNLLVGIGKVFKKK
jgi:serine/threonine protein phosphatase PrpC